MIIHVPVTTMLWEAETGGWKGSLASRQALGVVTDHASNTVAEIDETGHPTSFSCFYVSAHTQKPHTNTPHLHVHKHRN